MSLLKECKLRKLSTVDQVINTSLNKARVLHIKLARLAKVLKKWSKDQLA
jgi:hypothetical protein